MSKERALVGVAAVIVAVVLWSDTQLYESVRPEEIVAVDVPVGAEAIDYAIRRDRYRRRGRSFMRQRRR